MCNIKRYKTSLYAIQNIACTENDVMLMKVLYSYSKHDLFWEAVHYMAEFDASLFLINCWKSLIAFDVLLSSVLFLISWQSIFKIASWFMIM